MSAALLGVAMTACTPPATSPERAVARPGATTVATQEDSSTRYIALIGPKAQHAPPFLDVPGTNFYCLRSLIDRKTGEAAHQLYVSDSYMGAERSWNAARDKAGDPLRLVQISRHEITCEGACSYLEEFAANIPENELRANPAGLTVSFTARSGEVKTISVPGDWIIAQLAAVDTKRNPLQPAAARADPAPRE